jgi:hypothetical protein
MPLQKTHSKGKINQKRKTQKRKTQKKKKRRSKKGGNPREIAKGVFNFLTKKLKRISEGKDNYDDNAEALQALEERALAGRSTNTQGMNSKKTGLMNTLKNVGAAGTAAMREPCLAVALMNQGRCLSKSKWIGHAPSTYKTIGFDKTCNIETLQRAIQGFGEYRMRDTNRNQFDRNPGADWCSNHIIDGMIKVRDKKQRRQEKKHQKLLRADPRYRARYERMMNRLAEIKKQDNEAKARGDYTVAQKKGNFFEDEQVTIGGKKKSKRKTRKRNKRKRKTHKRKTKKRY